MESTKRLDLSGVQPEAYAVLRTSLPYGFARESRRVPEEERAERADIIIRWMVREWNVRDVDGAPLPAPRDVTEENIDLIPTDVVNAIVTAAFSGQKGDEEDPNSPGGDSSAS